MKEEWIKPFIEIIEFDTEDVIATSGGGSSYPDDPNSTNDPVADGGHDGDKL